MVDTGHRIDNGAPDAGGDESFDRLRSLHARASVADPGRLIELYLRRSFIQRVVREGAAPQSLRVGQEDGLAIRLLEQASGQTGFAAVSGAGSAGFSWALEAAKSELGPPRPGDDSWPIADSQDRVDIDPAARPATPETLASWVDEALRQLEELGAERKVPFRPGKGWVEVSTTVERWLAGDGVQATRVRNRAWAVVHPRDGRVGAFGPLTVATRRWQDLEPGAWSKLAGDRVWPGEASAGTGGLEIPVLFGPEASGALVSALVRAVHSPCEAPEEPVGPGWRIMEDPLDKDALFGSTFDDCCFPSRPRLLADGRRIVRAIGGRGNYRRPSFRDPPTSLPGPLVYCGPPIDLPRNSVLAASLSLHALSADDWILEITGGHLRSGDPGPRLPAAFIRISPRELVRRCLGSFGAPHSTHTGVQTPALLFAPLPLHL